MEPSSKTSVLEGDGICLSRILSRASSFGKSSRRFYRSGEGVPFRWEMQPGTPKIPQEGKDVIPPICPSPLMQCLGLPRPNLDHDDDGPVAPRSKMWRLREMVKKRINGNMLGRARRSKQQESSARVSSIGRNVSMVDGPFCCSPPWNIPDQGNTRIYYCSQHKNAYAVEDDGLFLSRIVTGGVSSPEQFSGSIQGDTSPAGVPFGWEMHPGTPKDSPGNVIIPPPRPPPAVQSLSLPQPQPAPAGRDKPKKSSTVKKAWFWIRRSGKKKESKKLQHEISFRYDGEMDEKFDASLRKSSSSSTGGRRNLQGKLLCRGPLNTRDVVVFARKKWNLFKSGK